MFRRVGRVCPQRAAEAFGYPTGALRTALPTAFASLSLPRRRGEGRGEGLRALALAAPPLIRPAATFSPPPRKGEGARRCRQVHLRLCVLASLR